MAEGRLQTLGPALIAGYVVLMTISWSPFPWNVQWSEIFFVALLAYAGAAGDLAVWRLHPVDVLVGGYLLGALPSFVRSSDIAMTAVQYAKHLYLVLLYVVFSRLVIHRRNLVATLDWLGVAAGVTAGVGVAAAGVYYALGVRIPRVGMLMPIPYVGEAFRPYGAFQSPEMFADYLVFAAPAVIGIASVAGHQRWTRWWLALAAVLTAAALTVTHALAGLAAATLFYVWERWRKGRLRVLRIGLAILTAALVVGFNAMLVVSVREVRYEHGTNPRLGPPPYPYAFQPDGKGPPMATLAVSYNWMSYYLLKRVAWETFWRSPFTGIGLGRFHEATERAYRDGEVHVLYRDIDPHSTLLGRLAETGIVGGATLVLLLAGFLWLGLQLIRRAGRDDGWPARAVLAGIVGLLVNSVNADVMNFRFLWIGFALLRGLVDPGPGAHT